MKKILVTLFGIALFLNIISLAYISPRKEDQIMNVIFSFLFLLLALVSNFTKNNNKDGKENKKS